ncbi:MAG: hypothetical protein GXX94_11115 [Chloroflexi bacterium]|nr:hypothetical protein [Chloroflexota bacterium]
MLLRRLPVPLLLVVALILLSGCGPTELLKDIQIRPEAISPNADGDSDVAEVGYTLTRTAQVSIYLIGEDGSRHDLRTRERRSKGERVAYFGGVVDGLLLPDGSYRVVFEAEDARGRTETAEASLTISGGDPAPLRIDNLRVYPDTFTPNRDGIGDRVSIGYSLSKEVERVDVYLLGPDGTRYPVREDRIREVGAPGTHEHDYDGGIDLGATPPPDGDYTVIVRAVDFVGNEAVVQGELTIEQGGVPLVQIVNRDAVIQPSIVALHSTLYFTCTVKNIGQVPVRTTGPEPGTVYSTSENYNTIEHYEEAGVFRVGMDYEGNSAGRAYPFRWQLGSDAELTLVDTGIGPQRYLMPGQTVTVTGGVTIDDTPVKSQPYFWVGLIHEQVWNVEDRVGAVQITVGY